MRRFVLAPLSLYLLLLAQLTLGQQPAVPVADTTLEKSTSLLPADVAELEIALGRLRLVPDHFRIVRRHEQTNGGQKSYQVSASEGRPALRLSFADGHEKWTVHIDSQVGAEWSRHYQVDGQPVTLEFTQRPYQPIVIKVVEGNKPATTLRGTTLWHLTDEASPTFIKYVLPSLARLNSKWDLPKALAAAKRMRDQSGLAARLSEHQLAQLLADLDSSDHRIRTVAKQTMREAGLAAQIPLEKLRQGPLSPQQRSTVDELLAGLEPRSADTPTRLAYWLSGDATWR